MSHLAHSSSTLLSPDRNPLLRFFLKKTFYAQYCAGETESEVRRTADGLKRIGFSGVILGYAREVVMSGSEAQQMAQGTEGATDQVALDEVAQWLEGTLETVRLAQWGDFVAVKLTGAGRLALSSLSLRSAPPSTLNDAMDQICNLAAQRGIRILIDAEQAALQPGIDAWTLEYMARYNARPSNYSSPTGGAIIYGTYQAYLRSTPSTLANHLEAASRGNFTIGVKLVRGAYLGSDPRHVIHPTKADTDHAYNALSESVLTRTWGDMFPAPPGERRPSFPRASLVLATHNAESVRRAKQIHQRMSGTAGETDLAVAQLQGMADEVSCECVSCGERKEKAPPAYKYLVWGSTGECLKYLLRRAQENKDAVQRTRDGRDAMRGEVLRRLKAWLGFA